jgi:hypothetical protein
MSCDVPVTPLGNGGEPKAGPKPRPAVTDKIAALEAQLAAAKAEAKEAAKARATIVGLAVVEAMKDDAAFARQIAALLKVRVKGARDKAAIADLLL